MYLLYIYIAIYYVEKCLLHNINVLFIPGLRHWRSYVFNFYIRMFLWRSPFKLASVTSKLGSKQNISLHSYLSWRTGYFAWQTGNALFEYESSHDSFLTRHSHNYEFAESIFCLNFRVELLLYIDFSDQFQRLYCLHRNVSNPMISGFLGYGLYSVNFQICRM